MVPTNANTYPFHSSDLNTAILKIKKEKPQRGDFSFESYCIFWFTGVF